MKKYQKRKRPPFKPRRVQSVAQPKVARDNYDIFALVFTCVAALAAAVSCGIALDAQESSDKVMAEALEKISVVGEASSRQASSSEIIAEATRLQASNAKTQADATALYAASIVSQEKSVAEQTKASTNIASSLSRSTKLSEQAFKIALKEIYDRRLSKIDRLRPFLVIEKFNIELDDKNFERLYVQIINNSDISAKSINLKSHIVCDYSDENCNNLIKNDIFSVYFDKMKENIFIAEINEKLKIEFSFFNDFISTLDRQQNTLLFKYLNLKSINFKYYIKMSYTDSKSNSYNNDFCQDIIYNFKKFYLRDC